MHPHFFHWHGQIDLKPEVPTLEPRWKAAEEFAKENRSASDINGLLKIAISADISDPIAARFSEALVVAEPTFPPNRNDQLLRVMASAALFSLMSERTFTTDAISIGLKVHSFSDSTDNPAHSQLIETGLKYLSEESERMRPKIVPAEFKANGESLNSAISKFSTAAQNGQTPELSKHFETLGRVVIALSTQCEEHSRLIRSLAEESQFLWWVVNRSSPVLKTRRSDIGVESYALVVAEEAASRVEILPPAASTEKLIEEAMSQCSGDKLLATDFLSLLQKATIPGIASNEFLSSAVTPISTMLQSSSGQIEARHFGLAGLDPARKITPLELSRRFFWERVYLSALEELETS